MERHYWLFVLIDRQIHQLYLTIKRKLSNDWVLYQSIKLYCPIIYQELYGCSLYIPSFPGGAVSGLNCWDLYGNWDVLNNKTAALIDVPQNPNTVHSC